MGSRAPVIALVDDDKIFQFTACKIFRETFVGGTVLQFENGQQALDFLKLNRQDAGSLPDILLLDINMPVLDGWMFLDDYDEIKAGLSKRITIYMVSSSIDPRDISRAKANLNVHQYVTKPLSRSVVTAMISSGDH